MSGTQGNTNGKSFFCNNTGTITAAAGGVTRSACLAAPVPAPPFGGFAAEKTSSRLNSVCNPTSNSQK